MKITMQKLEYGQEEIIIRYREMNQQIASLLELLSVRKEKLSGIRENGGQRFLFSIDQVLYFESVDGVTYAYLEKEVYRMREKLEELLSGYEKMGVVRCSRTMAVNLYKVQSLKSEPGGKILAALQNGEKIMISRKYAGMLRRQLMAGRE